MDKVRFAESMLLAATSDALPLKGGRGEGETSRLQRLLATKVTGCFALVLRSDAPQRTDP